MSQEKPVFVFEVRSNNEKYSEDAILERIMESLQVIKIKDKDEYILSFELPGEEINFKYLEEVSHGGDSLTQFGCEIEDAESITLRTYIEDEDVWFTIYFHIPEIKLPDFKITQLKWLYQIRFFDFWTEKEQELSLKPNRDVIVKGATRDEYIEYEDNVFKSENKRRRHDSKIFWWRD